MELNAKGIPLDRLIIELNANGKLLNRLFMELNAYIGFKFVFCVFIILNRCW